MNTQGKNKKYDLTFKAVETLKTQKLKHYKEYELSYNVLLIESAILSGKSEIDKLINPFLKPENIDQLFDVIDMMMYYGHTRLVNAMKLVLPEVRSSGEVLPHGIAEFEETLAWLILLNYQDPHKIAEELKVCRRVNLADAKEFVRLLSGERRKWEKKDFYKSDEVGENFFLLSLEFVSNQKLRSRAARGMQQMMNYLFSRDHWRETKKNETLLKLRKKSFEEYLESYFHPFFPPPAYRIACFLEVVPYYIEFVKEKGLVSDREYKRMLSLVPLVNEYWEILKRYL